MNPKVVSTISACIKKSCWSNFNFTLGIHNKQDSTFSCWETQWLHFHLDLRHLDTLHEFTFFGPCCLQFEWSLLFFPCFRSPDHIVYLKQPPNSQKEEDHLGRRRGSKAPRNNSYDITPQCFDGKFIEKQDLPYTSFKIASTPGLRNIVEKKHK